MNQQLAKQPLVTPLATGVAPHGTPPTEWSETKNVRWKVEIPGKGHATPIIWGDRVYIQTAIKTDREAKPKAESEEQDAKDAAPRQRRQREGREGRRRREGREGAEGRGGPGGRRGRGGPGGGGGRGRRGGRGRSTPTHIHNFALLALDRNTGKTIWQKTLVEELPHEGGHRDASLVSSSPVTDGKHLFAYFGSRGLFCLDMDGELIWRKDFGQMTTRNGFGEGSSPVLHGDTIVVTWDHEGDSFIVALDKSTGKEKWRRDRDEPTSWATPIVVEANGKAQVVASATKFVRGYDLATGELLWKCSGMTMNATPSPMSAGALVYAMSGFRGNAIRAIRFAGATGDISESASVAWKYDGKGTPYVPSGILYGDGLYFLDNNRAILSNLSAATGKENYTKQRLDGVEGVYSSIVGAADRLYVAGRNGATAVIKCGPEFKLLATNKLDDSFSASPAIVGDALFLRGDKHLYCIAKK
ncbi:MAG: PQQ-like beta-propeller repeat protein [Planctomycetes bacterium]|nr:PQQ-like beta-propeller repeat protein [Planctomycetota bacterium]